MRKKYASIEAREINLKKMSLCNVKVDYYKLKELEYGVEVVRIEEMGQSRKEESKYIKNITAQEDEIEEMLDNLISKRVMPNILEDVVHDFMTVKTY